MPPPLSVKRNCSAIGKNVEDENLKEPEAQRISIFEEEVIQSTVDFCKILSRW